jgi:hypothetical protein
LNLFFGDHCIAMISNKDLASEIRMEVPRKK